MQKIGKKIKQARLKKGLTQKELGRLSGVHEMSISKIERGIVVVKIETLQKIQKILSAEWVKF